MVEISFSFSTKDLAREICGSLTCNELVELFKEIEKTKAQMDLTEPMYKYLKEIMKKEDPEGL